jgi:hypothetical protein
MNRAAILAQPPLGTRKKSLGVDCGILEEAFFETEGIPPLWPGKRFS